MIEFGRMFTVSVAATDVEEKGKRRIRRLLENTNLSPLPEGWDWSRLVQEGEFRGKLPKRIYTYYRKIYGQKLERHMLASIGNKVDQYSFGERTYFLDFATKFDWSAGDFGDYGSCFWGCRKLARKALIENDVIAVRFFTDVDGKGYARAFVIRAESGLIIFNAYGLSCRIIAYILATLFDYPYRKKIDFYIGGDRDTLIWLNEDAHQIGLEPLMDSITVHFNVSYAWCTGCEEFYPIEEGEYNHCDEFICYLCS